MERVDLIWGSTTFGGSGDKAWGTPLSPEGLDELDTIAKDYVKVKFITTA